MNIGVDFDGVIVDSEYHFKYHFEKHAFLNHGREPISYAHRRAQLCFDLSEEECDKIFEECIVPVTLECPFMVGVREVLDMLRARGHKLFLVTARNSIHGEEELICAKKRLDELGFKFDGEFWEIKDKTKTCKENNITVMIDDDEKHARSISENGIHMLHFREKGVEKIPNGEYLTEVYNWMHIYREILKLERTKKR